MHEQQARKTALICAGGGALLLIFNYLSIKFNGYGYTLLPFIGSIALLLGLFGYFEPRIYIYKDNWASMPFNLKCMMIALVVAGALLGLCINKFVY